MSTPDNTYASSQGDEYDPDDTLDCPNCGGEGYVAGCFEEYACVDPEGGCDLCIRRCDWCNRPNRPAVAEGRS